MNALIGQAGSRAELTKGVEGSRIAVSDRDGRLLFAYDEATGDMTLSIPKGNLTIEAPQGSIALRAGNELSLGADKACMAFDGLDVRAGDARVQAGRLKANVGRLIQIFGAVYSRIHGLSRTLARRHSLLVAEDSTVRAGDIKLNAKRDIRADGKQIRLG